MALYRRRGLARRFGLYRISDYFRDSAAGLAKWEEEPSPELYFTADYRIEGESLLIRVQGETLTATLTKKLQKGVALP